MTYLRTDPLPLPYRVSLDRPHYQIGLADRPPEPFIVPRAQAKAPADPIRDVARFFAMVSMIGERISAFLRPWNLIFNRLDEEYRAARAELSQSR